MADENDLSRALSKDRSLCRADLYEANLYEANLYGANLYGADLRGADLRGADLRGANLRGADLYEANLRGADLYEANLYGADLYGADLRGADLYRTNLRGADLAHESVIDAGQDMRGYRVIGVQHDNGPMIQAGCRWFTLKEALEHWSAPKKSAECLRKVAMIEAEARARGWFADPLVDEAIEAARP